MATLKELKLLTVLYAEDDSELRSIMSESLQMLVKKVYAVSNGNEALTVYQNNSIDVIMMDIHMGTVSGLEVAKKIRETNTKIPIVIVTGSIATDDLLEACKLNLIEYLCKPIQFYGLMNVLYSAIKSLKSYGLLIAQINDSLSYDYFSKELINAKNEKTALTHNEIKILELLLLRRGQIVTYDEFSNHLEDGINDYALKNLISRLRKKMEDTSNLRNLSKIGYTLI